jgi:hypothetical protein
MAIVGAGVVVAVVMPFGSATPAKTEGSWQASVISGPPDKHAVSTSPTGSATVTFTWNSSVSVEVWWYQAGPCGGNAPPGSWCLVAGPPLATWAANTSGHWTDSGAPASAYCVLVENSGSAPVNFSDQFVESYVDPLHHLPLLPFGLIVGGGALLVGIGGLAIYLGAFLPSGVYQAVPGDEFADRDEPPRDLE